MVRSLSHLATMLAALAGAAICASPAAAQVGVDVGVGSGGVSVGASASGSSPDASVGGPPSSPDTTVTPAETGAEAGPHPLDQNVALDAVKAGRAQPLTEIMTLAWAETDGDIVDARLITAQGILLYELTVVEPDGDVSQLYFYARSGNRVRAN